MLEEMGEVATKLISEEGGNISRGSWISMLIQVSLILMPRYVQHCVLVEPSSTKFGKVQESIWPGS